MDFNTDVFSFLYSYAHRAPWLDAVGVFFAQYLAYIIGAVLLYWFFRPRATATDRMMIVLSVCSAAIARLVVKTAIILIYPHPRPYVVIAAVQPLIASSPSEAYQSFPSGHALAFFAVALMVCFYKKRTGAALFLAATLMGAARIFVGVHWPFDIFAGAVLGVLTSLTIFLVARRLENGALLR